MGSNLSVIGFTVIVSLVTLKMTHYVIRVITHPDKNHEMLKVKAWVENGTWLCKVDEAK